MDWIQEFNTEIERAEKARSAGNEGSARVSARRALGVLAGAYFSEQGRNADGSALDRIKALRDAPELDEAVRRSVAEFLTRVNAEKELAPGVDLIRSAKEIISSLFPDGLA